MVEIEFSYILDNMHDKHIWAEFMDEFRAQYGVKVNIREEMTWDNAWAELFSYTSINKPPHVSHIGSTWINSLARLKVLRPFKPNEIAAIGESWDFAAPSWESGVLVDDKNIWAIPWTTWIYVICYRKDLLQQTGIDPASAFCTIKATSETIRKLTASSLEIPWLNSQLSVSYRDFLHIAASWVWAAGGDFTDKEGKTITFNNPQAIQGLKYWLDVYCSAPAYKNYSQSELFSLFSQGGTAAMLTTIREANTFLGEKSSSTVRKNLGVASITDTPWAGGGSFVIWQHVQGNSQQEQAAVNLVKFLSRKETNICYQRRTASMPSRIDALKEIYPNGNPIREAVVRASTKGRNYYNIPAWRRIEQQLSETLGTIVNEKLGNPTINTEMLLHQHLDPLARKLNMMMYS